MNGSTSTYAPRVPDGVAHAAGGGTGTVPGTGVPVAARRTSKSTAPVPVPPPRHRGIRMADQWPLRDSFELGALSSAVPCAIRCAVITPRQTVPQQQARRWRCRGNARELAGGLAGLGAEAQVTGREVRAWLPGREFISVRIAPVWW